LRDSSRASFSRTIGTGRFSTRNSDRAPSSGSPGAAGILFAENCQGFHDVEKLSDDGRHAAENAGATCAAHAIGNLAGIHPRLRVRRVHRTGLGREHDVHWHRSSMRSRAPSWRIAREVLTGPTEVGLTKMKRPPRIVGDLAAIRVRGRHAESPIVGTSPIRSPLARSVSRCIGSFVGRVNDVHPRPSLIRRSNVPAPGTRVPSFAHVGFVGAAARSTNARTAWRSVARMIRYRRHVVHSRAPGRRNRGLRRPNVGM